ncbi:GerAB/ArcD/ProY family transporter [Sporolactobacillus terrae]|uniref:Uncharacterized protein n=1 Tax=Sporolactobacillus terrae TaxID=269673 RepID=A0A5K7WU17_9BACL|nr:endospore germination permease [Sporolactobacillus terrae]BBN97827.1 hypothetical protein St703_05320 [Sporolactobacillus terrae]
MIQSERISIFQFYLPIYVGIITTSVLTMPLVLYQSAEQNLWLPLIVGSLSGYLAVAIVSYLYHCCPQQTIIEILQQRMGRFVGTLFAVLLIICLAFQGGFITREYQVYLSINFYQFMPHFVLIGLMLAVALYAIRQGIEVLVRCTVLFAPLILAVYLLICVLIVPELSADRLLPLFDHGIWAPLRGTLLPAVSFSQFIWGAFYMPAVSVPAKKMFTSGCWFVLAVTLTLLIIFAVVVCFLGDATLQSLYPFAMVERYVQITGILERSSAFFMIVWLLGVFVKTATLLFILNLAAAQTFHRQSYVRTALPVVVLFFFTVLVLFPTSESLLHQGHVLLYTCSIAGNLVIPLVTAFYLFFYRKMTGKARSEP